MHRSASSRPKSRDPYAAADREDTAYGSLLSQGRQRGEASERVTRSRCVHALALSRGRTGGECLSSTPISIDDVGGLGVVRPDHFLDQLAAFLLPLAEYHGM